MQKKLRNLGGFLYLSSTYHEVFDAAKELKPITVGKAAIVDYGNHDGNIELLFTVRGKLLAQVDVWSNNIRLCVGQGTLEDTYEKTMLEAFLRGVQCAMLKAAQKEIEEEN